MATPFFMLPLRYEIKTKSLILPIESLSFIKYHSYDASFSLSPIPNTSEYILLSPSIHIATHMASLYFPFKMCR